ncbi:uncharacterized protein Z518_07356 [Rhinocladiella mackenziei CBS 650.93]|uniref:Uncharacterized protein n=1 Tax=Rhinocladiella mackenziei CBS 650.93 TaxID=1442369 RepID=A0A0D2H037_9EURO|nr:uncharacterized protein Z518_07356 [Rhinocladiella mackenziei CBS 650.93]KIX03803.1 hypothetical protein Z518_07356 [Rhinocladiella mackenziei CBS 650.93]
MASSKYTELMFVPQFSPDATKRNRELEIAKQKSHAAKVAHQKRKQKQETPASGRHPAFLPYPPENQPDEDYPLNLLRRRQPKITSQTLLDILPGGHSDPFNAQALPISPRVNQLITFIRDAYLPGVYITSFMKIKEPVRGAPMCTTIAEGFHVTGRRTAARVWESMKEELSDEGRALAWVSSYIPVLAKYSPEDTARDLNLMAIKMRAQSLRILKDRIANLSTEAQPNISLVSQIVSLFRASCKENDIASAKIHAEIIRHLIDRVEQPDRHIQVLFTTVMNNDTEVAVSHMRNTIFDFEGWVRQQLNKLWVDKAETNMPLVSEEYRDLHPCIQLPATRDACIRLRRYLLTRQTLVNLNDPQDLDRTDAVFTVFTQDSLYDSGVLINVYINLVAGKVYQMKAAFRHMEASIALTTLHVLRRGVFEATIYGGDHRIRYHVTTITHLEGTMRTMLKLASPEDLAQYGAAILWIFFYGARFEWRINKRSLDQGLKPEKTWFTEMFARQARELKITQWNDAREALSKFVFYEFLEPNLPAWYEETLSAGKEGITTAHQVW